MPSGECYGNNYEILDPELAKAYVEPKLKAEKERAKADQRTNR